MSPIEKLQHHLLQRYNVKVKFSKSAVQDIKALNKGKRPDVLLEIARRAKNGPLLKPDGVGEALRAPLHGFAKIKLKALNIRIVYRPSKKEDGVILMEIIAIGPRDKNKAYQLAAERLVQFSKEMEE